MELTKAEKFIKELHKNSCGEVRIQIEKDFPTLIEPEIKYDKNKIYALYYVGYVYKLSKVDGNHTFVNMSDSYDSFDYYISGQEAINYEIADGLDIHVFDNQKDFFTWALKQVYDRH